MNTVLLLSYLRILAWIVVVPSTLLFVLTVVLTVEQDMKPEALERKKLLAQISGRGYSYYTVKWRFLVSALIAGAVLAATWPAH